MKCVIKNSRLLTEFTLESLAQADDSRLKEVCRRLQIGTTYKSITDKEVFSKGRAIMQKVEQLLPKTRGMMETEIRKRLTIIIEVPKEFWSDEQREFFIKNNIAELKDINEEQKLKEEVGIRIVLQPFEKARSKREEALLTAEVSADVADYIKSVTNVSFTPKSTDENGRITEYRNSARNFISVIEKIAETPEEEEILKEEEIKKQRKSGIKVKSDSKDVSEE